MPLEIVDIVSYPLHTDCIVEHLLPAYEVHLIAGPSGSGKTTWMLDFIANWSAGEPVFGHKSNPLPFIYISCDRTLDGVKRVQVRAGADLAELPTFATQNTQITATALLTEILTERPVVKVFFIEGMTGLVPGGKVNDYRIVANFLKSLTAFCTKHRITVIGSVHSSKSKENERYQNPRERILGTAAWAGYIETIIDIQPASLADPDAARELWILPRNHKPLKIKLKFDEQGLLIPVGESAKLAGWRVLFDEFLHGLSLNATFETRQIKALSPATHDNLISRWLAQHIGAGHIEKRKHGLYVRTNTPLAPSSAAPVVNPQKPVRNLFAVPLTWD